MSEQNIAAGRAVGEVDLERAQRVEEGIKRIGRALDIAGDLGVWGAWVGREVLKREGEGSGE